jgi:hypothetical protein
MKIPRAILADDHTILVEAFRKFLAKGRVCSSVWVETTLPSTFRVPVPRWPTPPLVSSSFRWIQHLQSLGGAPTAPTVHLDLPPRTAR